MKVKVGKGKGRITLHVCATCAPGFKTAPGPNKHHARLTVVDGVRFGSAWEARRFHYLQARQAAGEITDLQPHPSFDLFVPGHDFVKRLLAVAGQLSESFAQLIVNATPGTPPKRVREVRSQDLIRACCDVIGKFTLDASYREVATGELVYEDAKGPTTRTTAYRLRKAMLLATYGITVKEVFDRPRASSVEEYTRP